MCAINGFNFKDEALIRKMNNATLHRGPDGSGVFFDDQISLGHDRLSIIDLSEAASQPMTSSTSRTTIVFNGEIYNYRELKTELQNGYRFKNQSDTEVILAAYEKWGRECVKKFNGIFAFSIWDKTKNELFLARDHVGVKPLYYFYDGKRFIFSSEIKAILEHDVKREVSREAFNFYFSIFYVPEPLTMFSGIYKLPAASWAVVKGGRMEIKKYWEVNDFYNLESKAEAREKIRELFDDSVRRQLISDRSVGVYLSGGIDSTAVLGAVRNATRVQPKTFSVGFDIEDESGKFNSDFLLARETAAYYGTNHKELVIGAKDVGDNLEKIAWHLDEPNFNPTAAAIYLLSKEAKKEVAVVLGGDGGDELFGGYPRYLASRLISYYQKLPRAARALFSGALRVAGKKELAEKLNLPQDASRILLFLAQKSENVYGAIRNNLIDVPLVQKHFAERYFVNRQAFQGDFEKGFMNLDRQSWLVDESLIRSDKMTMASGLEERVPILDARLIELSCRIPTAWKLSIFSSPQNFQGKIIWQEAVADYLPPHVQRQKKRGWFTPMAKWLRGPLKNKVEEILARANPNYFDASELRRVFSDHVSGKRYNLNMIWATLMWQLWHEKFIEHKN